MKNISKLFGVTLAAFITLAAQVVFSQERPRAHCDGQKLHECNLLAEMYRSESYGIPEIPNDLSRSDALMKTAIDGAITGCGGTDFDLCFTLKDEVMRPSAPLGAPRYTLQGRIQAYLSGTEAGCNNGHPEACYWRSVVFREFQHDTYEIGVSLKMAEGKSRSDAIEALEIEKRKYKERAHAAAKARVAALRDLCTQQNTQDCATLGSLLFSYKKLRDTPDEHLPHLVRTCSATHPKSCSILGFAATQIADDAKISDLKKQLLAGCHAGNGEKCMVSVRLARSSDLLDINATYEQACLHGSGAGCLERAINHLQEFERGNDADSLATGTELLIRACDLRISKACHLLEHLSKG